VPGIQLANACPNMVLSAEIQRGFLVIKRKVKVTAYCKKTHQFVDEPMIGCGQCHDLPEIFEDLGSKP
jgi:hypothetical protein